MQQLAKPSRTLPSTSKGLSEASPAGRPVAASLWPVRSLPPLFLSASQSDVYRSFSAAGRPLAASLWPVRSLPPLFLWASEGNVRHFGPASKASRQPGGLLRPLCGLSEASRQPAGLIAASLWPVRSLPPLFLWASEGNVRHFGPASKASRQPAGLLRPLCGLSEACLISSYGLPKATLGILDRLQKPLGSRQASCGLSVACPKPASSLLMGFRRQR